MLEHYLHEIHEGLSAPQKYLSSKFLYDETGDKIFQSIMAMPEYYLTQAELEIFTFQASDIIKQVLERQAEQRTEFDLIELGPGDGTKTKRLLQTLLQVAPESAYFPVDISQTVLTQLEGNLRKEFPNLNIQAMAADYFQALSQLNTPGRRPKLVLFLGSNLGNMRQDAAQDFLQHLRQTLDPQDQLLIGLDLKKLPKIIVNAYDDPHQITKSFNMNLLIRLNRELQANFDINRFDFYVDYCPQSGEVNSYLVSLKDQSVTIPSLKQSYDFAYAETIHTEVSCKYDLKQINQLAAAAGFRLKLNFFDCKQYFVDSLWECE